MNDNLIALEEFLDHIKERVLQGMIEQSDLINAVSYEEGSDPNDTLENNYSKT